MTRPIARSLAGHSAAAVIASLAAAITGAGCFDSLVSDPCTAGYTLSLGTCVLDIGTDAGQHGPDGGPDGPDAGPIADANMPDALVCSAPDLACNGTCIDVTSDPNNCGQCGRVCASGICQTSACVGDLAGHVVAIGHDYRSTDAAMARVLGNAIALGKSSVLHVGFYLGTADEATWGGVGIAARDGLVAVGRTKTDSFPGVITDQTLAALDTLVIEAQAGDGDTLDALGATWAVPLANFFGRGGVVIVLEGVAGTSYRAAHGANLYTVAAPPTDATSQQVSVVDATDAVAQQVPSPYLARSTSVSFPGLAGVVENSGGDAVVFHLTK